MNWRNNTQRYGWLSIGLHWFMLLLIAAVYACMELRDIYPKGSAGRDAMKTFHYMLGLSVLLLALLRLLLAATSPAPAIVPPLPKWQALAALLMKIGLYGLMIGLPLAGWLILSASGKTIPFFGLALPPLIAKSKDTADTIKELHEAGATVGYFLIGLHAAAGLYHHYVVRDNTLKRML
jgi:cytochrome b561